MAAREQKEVCLGGEDEVRDMRASGPCCAATEEALWERAPQSQAGMEEWAQGGGRHPWQLARPRRGGGPRVPGVLVAT